MVRKHDMGEQILLGPGGGGGVWSAMRSWEFAEGAHVSRSVSHRHVLRSPCIWDPDPSKLSDPTQTINSLLGKVVYSSLDEAKRVSTLRAQHSRTCSVMMILTRSGICL